MILISPIQSFSKSHNFLKYHVLHKNTQQLHFNKLNKRFIFNLSKASKSLKSLKSSSSSSSSLSSQKYTITKKFNFSQSLIYSLISRVDLYHEFIPYCTSSFITKKDPITNQPTIAGLRVGFQAFDEEFTCNLECEKPNSVIAKSITHSLFYFLETEWKLASIKSDSNNENCCIATLNLNYEFKSMLYNQVSSLFAKKVASLMTKAFEKRAFEVSNNNSKLLEYGFEPIK